MRIAELSPYYYPYVGGQEAYVESLSRGFVERGHEVTVITTSGLGNNAHQSRQGLEIRRHPAWVKPLNNPITFAVWREQELLNSCDIIHLHNLYSFLTLTAALARRMFRAPIVLTLHGELRIGEPLKDAIVRAYDNLIGKAVLRTVDRVFVDSTHAKSRLAQRGTDASKISVVPNGVDTIALAKNISHDARRTTFERFKIPDDARLILYVGRLIPRKGIGTLAAAFEKALEERRDLHLLVVGEGPLRGSLERIRSLPRGRDTVTIIPYLKAQDLHRCYQAADVFVLPSIAEGCPTVLLEALFFGCRVVATRIPGVSDHFAALASLVEPENASELSRGILSALEKPPVQETQRESVRRTVSQGYEWTKICETYLTVFDDVLRRDGR